MNGKPHPILRSGVMLGLIALLGTALLAGVNDLTKERIVEQEERRLRQQLHALIPPDFFNNNLLEDSIEIEDAEFFRHPAAVTVYRARLDGKPVAALMAVTTPDGYNGDIRLLTGIKVDGSLLGVRVVAHRETPGLGDPIEVEKSNWVLGFNGKSLYNPDADGWTVKRDGGQFDQFTGATISPRAVVKTVHDTLRYFEASQQTLFATTKQMVNTDE